MADGHCGDWAPVEGCVASQPAVIGSCRGLRATQFASGMQAELHLNSVTCAAFSPDVVPGSGMQRPGRGTPSRVIQIG